MFLNMKNDTKVCFSSTVGGKGANERRQLQDSDGRREANRPGSSGQPVREDALRLQRGLESV